MGCLLVKIVFQERHDLRSDNSCTTPGGQDGSVNYRHQSRAEYIQNISRHRAKPATITKKYVTDEYAKNERIADEHQCKKDQQLTAQDEAKRLGPADFIGEAAPEESSNPVED